MTWKQISAHVVVLAGLAAVGSAAYFSRSVWQPWLQPNATTSEVEASNSIGPPPTRVIVSDLAQQSLQLSAQQLPVETVWRTVSVPGMVVDRPGVSDRTVTAPVAAVVETIHHVPGDTVRPSERLFSLKVVSESLHQTQTELAKATSDIKFAKTQRESLAAASGAVPASKLLEADAQIARLESAIKFYRQELANRGFKPADLDAITGGKFISDIAVIAPPVPTNQARIIPPGGPASAAPPDRSFEIQELRVELGQHVQAGQSLCVLADHHTLALEGRAFADETPRIERSLKDGWLVEVDFQDDSAADWPPVGQDFTIRSIANNIDPVTRTFAFHLPLENQARAVERAGRSQLLWRYRPGQRVRLRVRVDEVKNVLVLPPAAVVRDGISDYVFTQNANTFTRTNVNVLFRERDRVIVANNGTLPTFVKDGKSLTLPAVALNAASQLNRMVKAATGGPPKGYHVHADGSLHKNEDEGK